MCNFRLIHAIASLGFGFMFVLGFGFEMGVVGFRNQVDIFFTVIVAIYIIRLIFFRICVLLLTR